MIFRIDTPESLGAAVRRRRGELGLTQEEVAGIANTGPRFVGELEAGKPTVQLAELLRVLGALGLDLEVSDR
ncbi:MAG: helix-turn-helix transcriptional regulator [Actinobacteria bacterium]|nr:helix-turn-helix transcriptional regulator [Actinomycetota bacterium]